MTRVRLGAAAVTLGLALCVPAGSSATCLDSKLSFETSALERLINDPAGVLAEAEAYWRDEPAQQFTLAWAERNGFTISRERWARQVEAFAELPLEARETSPLTQMATAVVERREAFLTDALRHVCSFLPADTDTGVPVYFTSFIPPRAFVTGGIVINVGASYWKHNADNVLNALIHEIWHVGYSRLRSGRTEAPPSSHQLYGILDQLQNEGTATYVASTAQSRFPAPDELDFTLLESNEDLDRSISSVNELLGRIGRLSERRLSRLSWELGVEDRAYYVAGAHMARTIDERLGRAELLRTIIRGPVSFAETYNSISGAARAVHVPDERLVSRRRLRARLGRLLATALVIGIASSGIWMLRRRSSGDS
jgi:hypothetical protein